MAGWPLRLLWPLLLLVAIWWPEWQHYQIDKTDLPSGQLSTLALSPSDDRLAELASIDLAEIDRLGLSPGAVAADLAMGRLMIPGLTGPAQPISGHPHDHRHGPPSYQLFMAGLAAEELLLRAHVADGQERWFELALERTLTFARHERAQHHDTGFLWNDHAIANRVSVIIELWRLLRSRPALRDAHGIELLSLALRSGRLLAKPDHFTVRTNHGVMQNLALLQLAAAFPDLHEADEWRTLAVERLRLQLGFYVSSEGVVLEHSSGYHLMGTALLAQAQRLLVLNGLPPLPALDQAVAASRQVLERLMRPDSSLPLVGNTSAGFPQSIPTARPDASAAPGAVPPPRQPLPGADWFPVAGWALWWTGDAARDQSQVMLTWSKHDGHGHKRPDEGSLHLWSGGIDWVTASGYWPYGDALTREAYSWRGANAPHAPNEPARSARRSVLRGFAQTHALHFADIERTLDSGPVFRRQVLQWSANSLLVLDIARNSPQGAETLWTTGPALRLMPSADGLTYVTAPLADGRQFWLNVYSPQSGLQTRPLRASADPFGGWVVLRGEPQAAGTVQVNHSSRDSIIATLIHVAKAPGEDARIHGIAPDAAAENWSIEFEAGGVIHRVRRQGDQVSIQPTNAAETTLTMASPGLAETTEALSDLQRHYAQAVRLYPPWRDLMPYRARVSRYLIGLWLLIEITLQSVARWHRSRHRSSPAGTAITNVGVGLAWLGIGYYVLRIYLTV